jgi:gamma-butyrobetaine dioxygenase
MATTSFLKEHSWTPELLRLRWQDEALTELTSLWLRDNCAADRDPQSGQRLVDITDVPAAPRLRSVELAGDAIVVAWEGEQRTASFALGLLAAHARGGAHHRPEHRVRRWLEGSLLEARRDFAFRPLAEVERDEAARLDWLTRLAQDGIAFLGGVPCTDRAIVAAGALMGQVAETNYGLVFDVRSVASPENLAYSDLGLGLHTDNPYRDPVPGFQALHVLVASPDGGDSLFADGFALAEHLRATDPGAFERLTRTLVPFLYRAKDAELYSEAPLIRLSAAGEVQAVHYNNRSIAPLSLPPDDMRAFYAAYRRLALLLREPRFQMRLRLAGGDLVVFDNQRTLHGRTAFSSARHPRHLQGCYLTRDSVFSRVSVLRRELRAEAGR